MLEMVVEGYVCIRLSHIVVSTSELVLFHHPSARSQEAAFEQLSPVHSHGSQDSMAEPNLLHRPRSNTLDVVNVDLLLAGAGAIVLFGVGVVAVLVELETNTLVALVAVRVCLVDLCVLGELAVGL